jgi:hypothetical protein
VINQSENAWVRGYCQILRRRRPPPYSGQGGQVYSNKEVVTLIRDPYNVLKRN